MESLRKLISESTNSYNIYTAYGYDDGSITIHQQLIDSTDCLKCNLFGHIAPVSCLSFSNNPKDIKLVSCASHSVIVWCLSDGKWKIDNEVTLEDECNTVSFSKEGTKIAIGMSNGKIQIRDANDHLNLIKEICAEESGNVFSMFYEDEIICGTEKGNFVKFNEEGNKIETKCFKNVPILWLDCNINNDIGIVCDDASILVYGSNGELCEIPFNKDAKPLRCRWCMISNSLTIIDDLGDRHDFIRLPNEEWKCLSD